MPDKNCAPSPKSEGSDQRGRPLFASLRRQRFSAPSGTLRCTDRPDNGIGCRVLVFHSRRRPVPIALVILLNFLLAPTVLWLNEPKAASDAPEEGAHVALLAQCGPGSPSTGRGSLGHSGRDARPPSRVRRGRDIVRQEEYRRLAVAYEIARRGENEVGVGAVHLIQEGVDHRASGRTAAGPSP
jgi:hypothetical protein